NLAILSADARVELIGPVDGEVASGEHGMGRMADPEVIAAAALTRATRHDLDDLRILITAGPPAGDPHTVRFLRHRSPRTMGVATAEGAAARGAVTGLIAGPVNLATPYGVRRVDVRGTLAMRSALWQSLGPDLGGADVLIMTAAVADYRPAEEHAAKLKREVRPVSLELVPNPDLLAEIGAARTRPRPVLVGFAVE